MKTIFKLIIIVLMTCLLLHLTTEAYPQDPSKREIRKAKRELRRQARKQHIDYSVNGKPGVRYKHQPLGITGQDKRMYNLAGLGGLILGTILVTHFVNLE